MLPPESATAIRTARILYSEILDRVAAHGYDVFSRRARVSSARKLAVAATNLGGGTIRRQLSRNRT
jgi:phytoene synthase